MIIWRGWGLLAVLYIALCAALLGGLLGASVLQSSAAAGPLAGIGIAIGGALATAHGWYLNIIGPRKRSLAWAEVEKRRLTRAADEGTLVIGNVRPSSREEAHALVDQVLENGKRQIGRHGPHSVFWIPMEVIAILAIAGGVVLAVATGIVALSA